MKRVLGSSLAALALMLCLASPAQAAEIPPTPECGATYKVLITQLAEGLPRNPTAKQEAAVNRKFAEGLAAADCISDAVPLYRNTRAKPFTDQCHEAAAKAQVFVGPMTAKLRPALRAFESRIARPYRKRIWPLLNRILSPKFDDKPREVARLGRRLNRLNHAFQVRSRTFLRKTEQIWADDAYRIVVTLWELRSLLCVAPGIGISIGEKPGPETAPADRFLLRNVDVVFGSLFYPIDAFIKGLNEAIKDRGSRASVSSIIEHPGGFIDPPSAFRLPFPPTD